VVVAAGTHHHVPASAVVHDGGTRMFPHHVLRPRGASRAYVADDQDCQQRGVWCVLLVAVAGAQPEGRPRQPDGVLRHGRDVSVQPVPGAGQVPVGGDGRGLGQSLGRAVHGRRLQDDHHRRR